MLPRHGLTAQSVPSMEPKETTRPVCPPPQSGKSSCVNGTLPFLGGAARRAAGGMIIAPHGGSGGIPPDTPLVTFVVKRKSPGCRAWQGHALAERPLVGSAEGQRPSHIGPRRGPRPCKAPEGDRSPPSTYTPKRTKSCIPTCNPGKEKNKKRKPPCFSAGPVLYSI